MSNNDELEQLEKSIDELTDTVAEAFGTPAVAKAADDDGGTISESELESLEAEVADLESSLNGAMNKVATQTWDERVAKLAADENIPTHIAMQRARRLYPEVHLYTKAAPTALRIFESQCKTTFATQSANSRHGGAESRLDRP